MNYENYQFDIHVATFRYMQYIHCKSNKITYFPRKTQKSFSITLSSEILISHILFKKCKNIMTLISTSKQNTQYEIYMYMYIP